MKIIKETCYKGTRILLGNEKRKLIDNIINKLTEMGFVEIQIPIIQYQETFKNKVGEENNNLMFNFIDRGNREVCLAPEYTAVIQKLSKTTFKDKKDVKVFYISECFRGEKPQAGRYRQFTQLGVEVINPSDSKAWLNFLAGFASGCISEVLAGWENIKVDLEAKRGLDYYIDGQGFEISTDLLNSSGQLCGGGEYEGGVGFALGIDRLLDLY